MNEEDYDRLLARLIEEPDRRKELLREADLDDNEVSTLEGLADTSDLLWLSTRRAPSIGEDPVAAMLGLVPDPLVTLDSKALPRLRKRSRLTISDLAMRLEERGWKVQASDVFRWESRSAPDVPPALIQAIAAVLHTTPNLISALQQTDDRFSVVRNTARFQDLVARWMKALDLSQSMAVSALETRMGATVHRGEEPDPEQLLNALDILVSAVESTGRINPQ